MQGPHRTSQVSSVPSQRVLASLLESYDGHILSSVKDRHLVTRDHCRQGSDCKVSRSLMIREHCDHGHRFPNRASRGL